MDTFNPNCAPLKSNIPRVLAAVIFMLALVAFSFAFAARHASAAPAAETHYNQLRTVPTATRLSSVAILDSLLWASPLDPHPTLGNPTLAANVDFNASGATCGLQCGLYFQNPDKSYKFLGVSAAATTMTASTTSESTTGRFNATAVATFDTRGATHYDLRTTAYSATTVNSNVIPWLYGSGSTPARDP